MKRLLLLSTLALLSCGGQPTPTGAQPTGNNGNTGTTTNGNHGNVEHNYLNRYTVILNDYNVHSYDKAGLNFTSNRVKIDCISANTVTDGSIEVRLYDGNDNMIYSEHIHIRGNTTTSKQLTFSAEPRWIEFVLNGYSGQLTVDIMDF